MSGFASVGMGGGPSDNVTTYEDVVPSTTYEDAPESLNASTQLLPPGFLTAYFTVQGVELILAAGGNLLTLVAILLDATLHTANNLLVASLAAADLSAAFALPLEVLTFLEKRLLVWNRLCLASQCFGKIFTVGNSVFILLIAIDRCVYITAPLTYHNTVTWARTKAAVLLSWVGIVAFIALTFLSSSVQRRPDGYCFDTNIVSSTARRLFLVVLVVPFILTVVLHLKVALVARRHRRQIEDEQKRYGATFPLGRESRITKTMAAVMGFYVLTTVPALVVGPILTKIGTTEALTLIRCLGLFKKANTFINPIVYAWRNPEFRKAFKRILHVRVGQVRPAESSEPTTRVTNLQFTSPD